MAGTIAPGYRIGCWEVVRALASGSWSVVYAARRTEPSADGLPQSAALKILPTGTSTRRLVHHLQEMVARETRRHSDLRHERLVRTYEVLVVDDPARPWLDGAAVLVMEQAGRSVAEALSQATGRPLLDAGQCLLHVAEGLQVMHDQGWVHGDLKPSNVLARADGGYCLADFGLATVLNGTHGYVPPLATPDYAPPERRTAVTTADGQQVRPSDDIWAFGVLACMVLAGRMPFPGATAWERARAADAYAEGGVPLALPDGLSPWHRDLVARCLASSAKNRPDAGDLVTALRTGAGAGPFRRPWYRTRLVAGGTALVLAASGASWTALRVTGRGAAPGSAPRAPASRSALAPSASGGPSSRTAPAIPANGCAAAVQEQRDIVTGVQWHQVWYCHSVTGAPQYSRPDGAQMVGWMVTTSSWFLCYRLGAAQGGTDVWYYTQGDFTATGWESRKAWGYTPARYVGVQPNPYPGVPECPSGT